MMAFVENVAFLLFTEHDFPRLLILPHKVKSVGCGVYHTSIRRWVDISWRGGQILLGDRFHCDSATALGFYNRLNLLFKMSVQFSGGHGPCSYTLLHSLRSSVVRRASSHH